MVSYLYKSLEKYELIYNDRMLISSILGIESADRAEGMMTKVMGRVLGVMHMVDVLCVVMA